MIRVGTLAVPRGQQCGFLPEGFHLSDERDGSPDNDVNKEQKAVLPSRFL